MVDGGRGGARRWAAPALLAVTLLLVSTALWREAGADKPMSVVDEHVHLDTHLRMHSGGFPHRGSLMGMGVVREWACGVGHEGGATLVPCGSPELGPDSLPSGRYTSGYVHYPTYFAVAEGYRAAAEAVGEGRSFVDTYRHFAALATIAGMVVCLLAGRQLGFRGSRLVAATLAPSASAAILLYGTIANPQSASILTGGLVAWSGLHLAVTGRGYWWLVAAVAVASSISVIQSLPTGAFILMMLAVLLLRRRGWTVSGAWSPRWWQPLLLAVLVVAPVVALGVWNAARATVPDSALYSFAAISGPSQVVQGAVWELTILHTPWYESGALTAAPDAPLWQALSRAAAEGVPLWMTLAVLGPLLVLAGRALLSVREDARTRQVEVLGLLAVATFLVLVLFPPALRVRNALDAGFDFGIVSRYAISFTPLLVWLLLLSSPHRPWLSRSLALLGTVGVVGVAAGIW